MAGISSHLPFRPAAKKKRCRPVASLAAKGKVIIKWWQRPSN